MFTFAFIVLAFVVICLVGLGIWSFYTQMERLLRECEFQNDTSAKIFLVQRDSLKCIERQEKINKRFLEISEESHLMHLKEITRYPERTQLTEQEKEAYKP